MAKTSKAGGFTQSRGGFIGNFIFVVCNYLYTYSHFMNVFALDTEEILIL